MIGLSIAPGMGFVTDTVSTPPPPPPPPPGDTLDVAAVDGDVEITSTASEITITITNSARFDGVYTVDPEQLSAGPVTLVAPSAAYADASTLSAASGLWLYSGTAAFSYQWRKDGSNLAGFTSEQLGLTAGDAGSIITVRQIATDTNGTRTSISNGITVAAAEDGFEDLFSDADGTLLADKPQYTQVRQTGDTRFETRAGLGQASATGGQEELVIERALAGDQWIEFEVSQVGVSNARMDFWLRRQSSGAGFFVRWIGDKLRVRGTDGAAGFSVFSSSYAVQTGDIVRYQIVGDQHQLFVNGEQLPEGETRGDYMSGQAAIGVAPTSRTTDQDQKISALRIGDV